MSLENMSDDELMEYWTAQAQKLDEAKAAVKECSQESDRRAVQKIAQERYEALSDPERAALAQVFVAQGIESQESVSDNG